MKTTKYLKRPSDNHVFEIDKASGCYRSYTTRHITDRFGNRPDAYPHFTFKNLTENYGFIIITKKELKDI